MERDDNAQQLIEAEEERLSETLNALNEVYGCGLHDTADFLARELGVKQWFHPD